ncbi:MAG: UPF0280 family protein [Alphaproteobacteria bacterium]|nr:UPF0280 family protein [Alphaproteobacteria bacterium]
MNGPVSARLPDGRLHLQHGPIDLIVEAFGGPAEVEASYRQAIGRFDDILATLVRELPTLRSAVSNTPPALEGPVARRMADAVWPYRDVFITPMAAVAGSVADEVLAALVRGRDLAKAYVNNGGDIAIHLAPGQSLRAAIVANVDAPALDGGVELRSEQSVRGLATSGWRGRSFSLGIADSVTILARTAATADAAATIVANAVDAEHLVIERRAANSINDDTDLGAIPVTTAVGTLPPEIVALALDRGLERARDLHARGLIEGAALALQGQWRLLGVAQSIAGPAPG